MDFVAQRSAEDVQQPVADDAGGKDGGCRNLAGNADSPPRLVRRVESVNDVGGQALHFAVRLPLLSSPAVYLAVDVAGDESLADGPVVRVGIPLVLEGRRKGNRLPSRRNTLMEITNSMRSSWTKEN